MRGLELRGLGLGPSVEAFAAALVALHADSGVACDHPQVDGVVEQQPQDLEQVVGRLRRVRLSADDLLDVRATEASDRLVAMLVAEPLDDIPAHLLCAGLQTAEFRRAVVGDAQRIERAGDGARCPDVARLRLTPSSAAAYWRMNSSDQGMPVR